MELFHAAARRTNELHAVPEWYNSATHSCTTALVDLVNTVLPKELRSTPRVRLPGYLPKFWAKQGVLKLSGTLEETLASAEIDTDRVLAIGYVADFSARFHNRV